MCTNLLAIALPATVIKQKDFLKKLVSKYYSSASTSRFFKIHTKNKWLVNEFLSFSPSLYYKSKNDAFEGNYSASILSCNLRGCLLYLLF